MMIMMMMMYSEMPLLYHYFLFSLYFSTVV